MTITNRKQDPRDAGPRSLADDPGACDDIREIAKRNALAKLAKMNEKKPVQEKPQTKKAIQEAAKAEKAKAMEGKPDKLDKFFMNATWAGSVEELVEIATGAKAGKNGAKGSQKSKKDSHKPPLVENRTKPQSDETANEYNEKRKNNMFLTCVGYSESLVEKSRYKGQDPKKLAYAAFLALPECSEYTQNQFAEYFDIHPNTTTNWKFDTKVMQARQEIMMKHFQGLTPLVVKALMEWAQKKSWTTGLGDAAMIKLALQYVEKWNEKSEVDLTTGGAPITWGVPPSQFVKAENIPNTEEEGGEPEDIDPED